MVDETASWQNDLATNVSKLSFPTMIAWLGEAVVASLSDFLRSLGNF